MKYDILADWRINMLCNFKCKYCFFSVFIESDKKQNIEDRESNIKKIVKGFNKSGLTWLIHITGGEPFLQPNFLDLCKGLTKEHYIDINTNLSTMNVYDFAKQINPKKVASINCSLHIDERERLNLVEDFISKYNYLKRYNFNIYVTQVLYPPILQRFDKIFDFFRKNGVIVKPKVFRGYYKQKHYPANYTKEEREKILKYCEISEELDNSKSLYIDPSLDKKFIYGDLSFSGLLCKAGKDYVVIEPDGEVMRCHGVATKIRNIFEGKINLLKKPEPCSARICPCPYSGLKYAEGIPKILS